MHPCSIKALLLLLIFYFSPKFWMINNYIILYIYLWLPSSCKFDFMILMFIIVLSGSFQIAILQFMTVVKENTYQPRDRASDVQQASLLDYALPKPWPQNPDALPSSHHLCLKPPRLFYAAINASEALTFSKRVSAYTITSNTIRPSESGELFLSCLHLLSNVW